MITIARIDERLIQGQVGYAWSVVYKSDAIMVIDNEISKDKFQISLLQMACPAGVKCFVCDEDKAVEMLNKYAKKKIFVVVKHPGTLLHICLLYTSSSVPIWTPIPRHVWSRERVSWRF